MVVRNEHMFTHNMIIIVRAIVLVLLVKIFVDGECVSSSPKCDFGYHNDTSKTGSPCIPDKECPKTMKYFAKEVNWGFDLKICTPRQDLTPEECANQGGSFAVPVPSFGKGTLPNLSKIGTVAVSDLVTVLGKGCYDVNYIKRSCSR